MTESIESRLAPSVDRAWAEKLVVELRLQGVSGDRIGAALSEVESHCAESGASAADAFGDPVDYVRALRLPSDPDNDRTAVGRAVAPVIVQVLGMFAVLAAAPALRATGLIELRAGQLAVAVLFLAAALALVLAAEPLLRAALARPVLAAVALTAVLALIVLTGVLLPGVIAVAPAWPVLVIGVAALVGGVLWALAESRGEDEISSPVPGVEAPRARVPGWLPHLLVPAAAAVGVLLVMLLS